MAAESKTMTDDSQLLTSAEREALSQITNQEPPYSQRAQALLAIDAGATQPAASQQAGLTLGQVRYWLDKFRESRLSIFPEAMLVPVEQEAASAPLDIPEPPAPGMPDLEPSPAAEVLKERAEIEKTTISIDDAPTLPPEPPQEKKKSQKKSGKAKKSKKPKKEKKGKKGKKPKKRSKKGKPAQKKKAKDSKGKSGKKKKKKRQ